MYIIHFVSTDDGGKVKVLALAFIDIICKEGYEYLIDKLCAVTNNQPKVLVTGLSDELASVIADKCPDTKHIVN